MKRRVRFGFFGYLTVDYKAAQAYLDARAAEGWALAEVWLGIVARFRRTSRTDLRYFLDIADPVAEDTDEHRARCREAGWEKLYTVRYMNIYRSLPGAETACLREEDDAVLQRYRGDALRWMAACFAALAALTLLALGRLALLWMAPTGSLLWLSAASGAVLYLRTVLPAVWAGGAVYLFALFRRRRQWAAGTGEDGALSGPKAAKARGMLTVFTYLGTAALLGFAVLDLVSAPTVKPIIILACVTAAAFLITLCSSGAHMRQPRRVRLWRCAALAVFVLAVGLGHHSCAGALSEVRGGLAEQLPVLSEGPYGGTDYDSVETGGSFLLGYVRGSKDIGAYSPLVVEYYRCSSNWMAEQMAKSLRSLGMKPSPEVEGLWTGLDREKWEVISCRGREVRYASVPMAGFHPLPDGGVLAWVEESAPWPTEEELYRILHD